MTARHKHFGLKIAHIGMLSQKVIDYITITIDQIFDKGNKTKCGY